MGKVEFSVAALLSWCNKTYVSSRYANVGELDVAVVYTAAKIRQGQHSFDVRVNVPIPSLPIFFPISPMLIPGLNWNVLLRCITSA